MYEIDKINFLQIGVQGENIARKIEIDMTKWVEELEADGVSGYTFGLIFKPYNDPDKYPMVTTYNDETHVLTWRVSAAATQVSGVGYTEIRAQESESGLVKKTRIIPTAVEDSVSGNEVEPPEPQEEWVTAVLNAGEDAVEANEAAQEAKTAAETARDAAQAAAGNFQDLSASVTGLAAGTSPTVNVTHSEGGYYNLAFGIPKGDKGDQGDPAPEELVVPEVDSWLGDHITNPSNPPLDTSLSLSNAAAPANLVGALKSEIIRQHGYYFDWVSGYYKLYNPSPTNIDIINDISSSANYVCQAIEVAPGDVFVYSGKGSSSARWYALLKDTATNNVLYIDNGYGDFSNKECYIVIPEDCKYLIVNADARYHYSIRKSNYHNILEGTHLNNLTTEGIYICTSNAVAETLEDKPTKGINSGFRLDVQKIRVDSGNEYIRQIITTNTTEKKYEKIYFRVITSYVGDWILLHSGNEVFPNINDLQLIASETDLDDLTTPGTYYCPNGTTAKTLLNLPFFVDTGFSLHVMNSGSIVSGTNYIRQIIYANKTEFSSIYTRAKNASDFGKWQLMISSDMYESPNIIRASNLLTPTANKQPAKKTIRVATNNVAHYWLQGQNPVDYLSDHPDKIVRWKSFLMKSNIDILFMQECEDYIDEDREINAFSTLYSYFFDSDNNLDPTGTDITAKQRRKIYNRLGLDTETEMVTVETLYPDTYNKNGYFNWCIVSIDNVGDVLLVNVHNFSGTSADRIADRNNYLNTLKTFIAGKNCDYFVIAGDFNNKVPEDDDPNIVSFCTAVSGVPVNGGLIGWFATCNQEELARAYDNIIVSSNIRIESIECDPVLVPSGTIHTDHTPVIATISFT